VGAGGAECLAAVTAGAALMRPSLIEGQAIAPLQSTVDVSAAAVGSRRRYRQYSLVDNYTAKSRRLRRCPRPARV
jgi:hypothetical protein